jgi:hypothetical protein
VTIAFNDGEEDIPPQWVTRDTLVACIILAARLNHMLDLDEASARRLVRHVVAALISDPDNTLDARRPFACRTDDGRLEEIDLFSDYRTDSETWDLTRVEQPLWGDRPIWIRAGSLEVSWYKFEQAVAQALRGPLPVAIAGPAVARAVDQDNPEADAAPPAHYEPATDLADGLPQASDVGSNRPLLRVHLDAGEVLETPPDWPLLPPPTPGESAPAYMGRAILGDRFFQEVEKLCGQAGLARYRLRAVRPATCALVWWERKYPDRVLQLPWAAAFPDQRRSELSQLREPVYRRLVVELCERLRAGDFRAKGQRIDVVGGSPEVPGELWGNPDMILLPSGELRPQQRQGHPPPGVGLPTFVALTVWPPQPNSESPRRGGGRRPKYDWDHVMDKLLERLRDDGIPEAGDGGQAELERFAARLFPADRCPTESVIREKVKEAIETYRKELGC